MSKIPVGEGFKFSDDSEQSVAGIPEADEDGIQYTRGDAQWDPSLGAVIAANLTLTGTEPTAIFTLVATNSRDLTLALASTVASDYLLTLHNQSDKRSIKWAIKTQGSDTINGGTSFSITTGETYLVERISSTEYFISNASVDQTSLIVATSIPDTDEIVFYDVSLGVLVRISRANLEASLAEEIAVASDSTLTGDGTTGDPLSVVGGGGVNNIQMCFSRGGNTTSGTFLMSGDVSLSAILGPIAPSDMILKTVTIARGDTDSADIEVLFDGVVVATVSTSAIAVVDTSMSEAVSQGDVISVRNSSGSNTVSDAIVTLLFEV